MLRVPIDAPLANLNRKHLCNVINVTRRIRKGANPTHAAAHQEEQNPRCRNTRH
jgi:hypothetical protein